MVKTDSDMTTGEIWRHLLTFSVPMALGLLFQQLYNMVDTLVVGQFVGETAQAAVGTTGSIINTIVGFCAGLATGASVLISQRYGAHDMKGLSRAVHTTITMTVGISIISTAIGLLIVEPMLRFMQTPENVWDEAKEYLTIYFSGVTGVLFYNMGSGILRAVGDSRRPLFFLIISAVLNTVLDLVFVLSFHLGVRGVSYFLTASTPNALFYGRVLVLGVACGLLSILVCYTFSGVRTGLERLLPNPYPRVIIGGAAVVLLTLGLDTKLYLGTGQVLIDEAIRQGSAAPEDVVWKLLFTALTLGAGCKGGEIVPSFAMGASFGCVLGPLLGLPAPYAAAVGMVSLFCGVTNCPLTALVLGFEVFSFCNPGGFLVGVAASFLVSGYGGLYSKQKFAFSKVSDPTGTLHEEERYFEPKQ